MKTAVTFHLRLHTREANEVDTLTLLLENVPRADELVDLDVTITTGERVHSRGRVKDVQRRIAYHPDSGTAQEEVHVYLA
jgi:predicted nucleic acid-binding OB-fold protein